jgi:uncharacterized membrane protein YccC
MMQLSQRKTWSQEALDVKQRLAAPGQGGFFTYEKRAMLLLAVKTAMAAGICYWLARLVGLQDGYWGSISAIIVLQSNVGSTVTASRDRLIGTLIGAGFGAVFSLLGEGLWTYLLAVITAMVACSLLGLKNSSRLAAVTVTILMLVHRTGSNWTLPLHRVIEVLLGIVVALLISTLVLPSRARARLREGLVQEFLLLGSLFVAVMEGFRGKVAAQLAKLRTDVQAAVEANAQLLAAARNEPSGSGASLEGLSLLHQFGRELEDVLQALELASARHDSGGVEGGYAAQLEPELSALARDVYRGFQFMAGCIHRWKFDVAPEGFSLEEDIAALEAKMAAVRPTGFSFPQEEILRAYAVQLHLKQLARMLRSSRVEANETVG